MTHQRLAISLSSASLYPLPVRPLLPMLAEVGLDGIEYVLPPWGWPVDYQALADTVRDHGLEVLSVHQVLLPPGPRPSLADRMVAAVEAAIKMASPCVVMHTPHVADWSHPQAQRWMETLWSLMEQAKRADTILTVENTDSGPEDKHRSVLSDLNSLAACAQDQDLGITLDTCHADRSGVPLLRAYETVRQHVANVHYSDRRDLGSSESSALQRAFYGNHLLPGEGQIPLKSFIARLAIDRYKGPITLELSPWALRSWSPSSRHRNLRAAVTHIRQVESAALAEDGHLAYP